MKSPELQEKSAGYHKIWSNTTMGCLLWMDDVVLIHHDKGNPEAHLKAVKGKVEAALQTIFCIAGNDEFRIVKMAIIWKLVHTCLIPILTHGAETWMPSKAELTKVQRILYNPIQRILKAQMTTPSEIITAETGIWDIETQVAKKQ